MMRARHWVGAVAALLIVAVTSCPRPLDAVTAGAPDADQYDRSHRPSAIDPQGSRIERMPEGATGRTAFATQPRYIKGRFVVKFKGEGTHALNACAHCLLLRRAGTAFRDATADHSDSLDRLNQKHRVRRAKPLFRSEEQEARLKAGHEGPVTTAQLHQHYERLKERARQKNPKRFAQARSHPVAAQLDFSHVYVFEVPVDADIPAICDEYRKDPHVDYALPDVLIKAPLVASFEPNDYWYRYDLWGIKRIMSNYAWSVAQGGGVPIAVVDSGAQFNHEDLAGGFWSNADPVDGIDNDGNGYVDDEWGRNFVDCNWFNEATWDCVEPHAPDNNTWDDNGHGTAVAGVIAASGNNGIGVIGVAFDARMLPVKVFNRQGRGSLSWFADGLFYAAATGAWVIHESGICAEKRDGCFDVPYLQAAMASAYYDYHAVVVIPAGNDADDTYYYSPQWMSKPIVVSASNKNDQKASFSDYGLSVDNSAPGVDIRSTWLGGYLEPSSGTSLSSPHVSGLAALILSRDPTLANWQVADRICATADDTGPAGFDVNHGCGRINAARAVGACYILTAAYGRPDAPAIQTLWALHHRLVPDWNAPWHQAYLHWYDRVGPKIAAFINDQPALKTMIRALFTPAAHVAHWWLARPGWPWDSESWSLRHSERLGAESAFRNRGA